MTTKAVAILQLLICGGSARIVQVDTDTTFVVGHRISMVHPGHLDTLSDRDELHIEIKTTLERWPIHVGGEKLEIPIVLDGREKKLSLPSDHKNKNWFDLVVAFCAEHSLSSDNQAWLYERVNDLARQWALGLPDDAALLRRAELCIDIEPSRTIGLRRTTIAKACVPAANEIIINFAPLPAGTYTMYLCLQLARNGVASGDCGGSMTSDLEEKEAALPGFREVDMNPRLVVTPAAGCSKLPPLIEHPNHGAVLGPTVALKVAAAPMATFMAVEAAVVLRALSLESDLEAEAEATLCLALDGYQLGCHPWPPAADPYLRDLASGVHALEAWWQTPGSGSGWTGGGGGGRTGEREGESSVCRATASFEIAAAGPCAERVLVRGVRSALPAPGANGSRNDAAVAAEAARVKLVFVTGASQRYVDGRILQNLVGSIHFWEPHARIEVWDFGLDEAARADVAAWRHVTLRSLPPTLPPHLHVPGFGAYAAKAWATRESLRIAAGGISGGGGGGIGSVLWIDANCELRRPLAGSALVERLLARGAFFVTHPFGFPSPQFHFPPVVARLGCPSATPLGSLPHCATTLMGFTTASEAGRAAAQTVLEPLVACGLDPACVHPEGSSRLNHRQEQTALNAILCAASAADSASAAPSASTFDSSEAEACAAESGASLEACQPNVSAWRLCTSEPRFRLTSDFENRDHPLQPTVDPRNWNDMAFYTRRGHPSKPYLPHLRRV